MAQTKKKRRRKHRGTQGGRIDTRPARGRPRSRAEAKNRARSRQGKKGGSSAERVPNPPSWNSAFKKGGIASILFLGLLSVMGQPPISSALIAVVMMAFYVPLAFLMDRFFHDRYQRKEAEKRAAREQQRHGAGQAEG